MRTDQVPHSERRTLADAQDFTRLTRGAAVHQLLSGCPGRARQDEHARGSGVDGEGVGGHDVNQVEVAVVGVNKLGRERLGRARVVEQRTGKAAIECGDGGDEGDDSYLAFAARVHARLDARAGSHLCKCASENTGPEITRRLDDLRPTGPRRIFSAASDGE